MAIKLDSSGPIFYGSERVGRHGKRFRLLKFRTMRVGADQTGQVISTSDDPRQTRLGKFLRHWKLDELPNFVNVLKGEMSIVGPRPEAAKYVALYSPEEMRVLAMRPGITDSAVSSEYRDEQHILDGVEDPEEYYQQVILKDYLAMNLKYVDARPSLARDLAIIAQTVRSVLFGHAAPVDAASHNLPADEGRAGGPKCTS